RAGCRAAGAARVRSAACCSRRGSRGATGSRRSEERTALVFAEDVAHRVADLADRAAGAQRLLDRRQQVAVALRGRAGARAGGGRASTAAWSRLAFHSPRRLSWRFSASGSTFKMSTSSIWSVTYLLTPTTMSWPVR